MRDTLTEIITNHQRFNRCSEFFESRPMGYENNYYSDGGYWHYDNYVELLKTLDNLLEEINRRESIIINLRLDGYTLEEISKILGVNKERVRQLEQRAIKHLKDLLKKTVEKYNGLGVFGF